MIGLAAGVDETRPSLGAKRCCAFGTANFISNITRRQGPQGPSVIQGLGRPEAASQIGAAVLTGYLGSGENQTVQRHSHRGQALASNRRIRRGRSCPWPTSFDCPKPEFERIRLVGRLARYTTSIFHVVGERPDGRATQLIQPSKKRTPSEEADGS